MHILHGIEGELLHCNLILLFSYEGGNETEYFPRKTEKIMHLAQ